MTPAETSREVPMLPRTIQVIVGVIGARFMPYPLAVGVDVGCLWVSGFVSEFSIFLDAPVLQDASCPSLARSRAVSRDVSATDVILLPSQPGQRKQE